MIENGAKFNEKSWFLYGKSEQKTQFLHPGYKLSWIFQSIQKLWQQNKNFDKSNHMS